MYDVQIQVPNYYLAKALLLAFHKQGASKQNETIFKDDNRYKGKQFFFQERRFLVYLFSQKYSLSHSRTNFDFQLHKQSSYYKNLAEIFSLLL